MDVSTFKAGRSHFTNLGLKGLKAPYSLKIDILLSKKTDMWEGGGGGGGGGGGDNYKMGHLTACKISFSLSF